MADSYSTHTSSIPSQLTSSEEINIDQKIEFEIAKSHFKMLRLGAIANIVGGALFVWAHSRLGDEFILSIWYGILLISNVCNVIWANRFNQETLTPQLIKQWRSGFLYIFIVICFTWSALGVVFIEGNVHLQLTTLAFLLAVLICFSFSSAITDFTIAALSVLCLLLPAILYHIYLGGYDLMYKGHDVDSNLGMSASFFMLGAFIFITCYLGHNIVRKFFRLNFENAALNSKLESMNKFLEHRVQERTSELEDSLKLVTYQATHDLLTDLPNQRLLLEYMPPAMKLANQHNHSFAVVFFFVNEIDQVNDGLGYQAGEMVIQTVAQRLQKAFPNLTQRDKSISHYTITLSRKDVFIVLIDPLIEIETVEEKVNNLFDVLIEPVQVENHIVKLTASAGISLYPRDGKDVKSLLINADVAMLQAKLIGGNSQVMYASSTKIDLSRQLQVASHLHEALTKDEFLLHYQPLVDLKTGEITGLEALVRWDSPVLGFVPPDHFISLAESNGTIVPLGEWVFRTACQQTKKWHDQGFDRLKIAINLSAKQLQSREFLDCIASVLAETKLDPKFIELELTESEAFQKEVIPLLKEFKELGLCLSIDDFGTGYSGLTSLKHVAIDKLKIDKSFIDDITTNEECRAIVSNTINLAKKMKITVLAEGVETKEQLDFLIKNDCDMMQGYYFSRPVKPEAITELLHSHSHLAL